MINSNIAVVSILVNDDKCLFLNRNKPPLHWGAPAGRLYVDEEPVKGLRREVFEETGISDIDVILPLNVWQGEFSTGLIYSITYVCTTNIHEVRLSDEHSDYRWIAIDEFASFQGYTDFDLKPWPVWIKLALEYRKAGN